MCEFAAFPYRYIFNINSWSTLDSAALLHRWPHNIHFKISSRPRRLSSISFQSNSKLHMNSCMFIDLSFVTCFKTFCIAEAFSTDSLFSSWYAFHAIWMTLSKLCFFEKSWRQIFISPVCGCWVGSHGKDTNVSQWCSCFGAGVFSVCVCVCVCVCVWEWDRRCTRTDTVN